jgi:2-hydroxy-6-oxonona-2,4-dienedioate hydrolase
MWILLAAFVGLTSSVVLAYRRDVAAARRRVATGSVVARTRCGPVEYAATGDGPPVLVVHGAGGGYDQGLDIGAPLFTGFRVIAVSRFGYLRTPLPRDASAVAQADAFACLLDELGIERVAVLGASAGAPSAMQFALHYPERCSTLILLVPAAYAPRSGGAPSVHPVSDRTPRGTAILFEAALRTNFLFWLAPRISRAAVVRALLGTPPALLEHASTAEQARVAVLIEHILPVTERRSGLANDARVVSSLERYDLERIAVPTLAISMADDLYGTYEGARYTAENVPGARFVGYPRGGHLGIGATQDITNAIATFLRQAQDSGSIVPARRWDDVSSLHARQRTFQLHAGWCAAERAIRLENGYPDRRWSCFVTLHAHVRPEGTRGSDARPGAARCRRHASAHRNPGPHADERHLRGAIASARRDGASGP